MAVSSLLSSQWMLQQTAYCACVPFHCVAISPPRAPSRTVCYILLLLSALQPAVGFGLSNNTSPFFPICHQLSPSSHLQHSKISFYFFSPSFPGSSSSSRPFQFLSEDLFGNPILLHSLQVTQPTYPLPLYSFYYIFSFTRLFCTRWRSWLRHCATSRKIAGSIPYDVTGFFH